MFRPTQCWIVAFLLSTATQSFALPPGAEGRAFREGANHHLGDDSFLAQYGRAPAGSDGESRRMHAHLVYVRGELGRKAATRPELSAKRAELLGYLDDYIAKGITPVNTRLPWRSPVFIDESGNVCAVGYLIERSVGRPLSERIAREHRYDFLEDIADALPEVRAWAKGSGFTLDELARIQPGYLEPVVESWHRWNLSELKVAEGAYADTTEGGETHGAFVDRRMDGVWTRTIGTKIVGKGTLKRGAGNWQSFYADGSRMAEGPYLRNHPHGEWTLFHPSGNVAAIGRFVKGVRNGRWQFFYDTGARTPIASGAFVRGAVLRRWKHFDSAGKLLATSMTLSAAGDAQRLLTIVPGDDGVQHRVHSTGGPDGSLLHAFVSANHRFYVTSTDHFMYDVDGNSLSKVSGVWQASNCGWSAERVQAARRGNVRHLHSLLGQEPPTCGQPTVIPHAQAETADKVFHAMTAVRAQNPEFIKQLVLGEATVEELAEREPYDPDLPRLLAANLGWYIEWPHIDGQFTKLFPTLAGHARSGM